MRKDFGIGSLFASPIYAARRRETEDNKHICIRMKHERKVKKK